MGDRDVNEILAPPFDRRNLSLARATNCFPFKLLGIKASSSSRLYFHLSPGNCKMGVIRARELRTLSLYGGLIYATSNQKQHGSC